MPITIADYEKIGRRQRGYGFSRRLSQRCSVYYKHCEEKIPIQSFTKRLFKHTIHDTSCRSYNSHPNTSKVGCTRRIELPGYATIPQVDFNSFHVDATAQHLRCPYEVASSVRVTDDDWWLMAQNLLNAFMKEDVTAESKCSMWAALLVRHVNMHPHILIVEDLNLMEAPILTSNSPKRSTPTRWKGADSVVLSGGRKFMLCSCNLARIFLHVTQWCNKDLANALPPTMW